MKISRILQNMLFGCAVMALTLQSCNKEEDVFDNALGDGPAPGASRTEQTLDSIFLYAKEIYLWHEALPSYKNFNPRKYKVLGSGVEVFEKELYDISQLKINSLTGNPFEWVSRSAAYPKYSYIQENNGGNGLGQASISSISSDGTEFDFGLGLASVDANDIRIRYVYPGSPAGNAGLNRGDRLTKVNDREVRPSSQSDVDFINSSMLQGTIKLTVQKPNGSLVTRSLSQATYTVKPVFKKKVLSVGNSTVGYLVFDTFTRKSNAQADLELVFEEFASAGVKDLVIDLRYNGGGYVETAEYLSNLIAPKSLEGSVMYKERYNELMQSGGAKILRNQVVMDENNKPKQYLGRNATYADLNFSESNRTYNFRKLGNLENIESVVFIVSSNTASASELVINSLKPYMNVALVGEKTYGKPVGFFGITIDQYKVFMPNFQTINSNGEGEYFDGFEADIKALDDVRYDFGDLAEESLGMALAYIQNGRSIPSARIRKTEGGMEVKILEKDSKFKGLIEDRFNFGQK